MITLPKMKSTRVQIAARIVALACCFTLGFLCGCGKGEAPATAAADSWAEDPAFKKDLGEQHAKAKEIGSRRAAVAKRMNEMVSIMKEKLATTDEKKVVEELEKNAEWRALKEKAAAIDAEFEKQRKETLSRVRQQMNKGNFSK